MSKGWYVLHVYSGYENKIEKTIRLMMENGDLPKDAVTDVKVPAEEVVDVKDGKKRVMNKKFLPGYILVEMDLDPRPGSALFRDPQVTGVTGFVGTRSAQAPTHIQDEARGILQKSARSRRPGRSSPPVLLGGANRSRSWTAPSTPSRNCRGSPPGQEQAQVIVPIFGGHPR
jgi:transcriptional antiterminator NusG